LRRRKEGIGNEREDFEEMEKIFSEYESDERWIESKGLCARVMRRYMEEGDNMRR
jgi:hypothetical protein